MNNLTDLNAVKILMNKVGVDVQLDAALSPLIQSESQEFVSSTFRDGFEAGTYTEIQDGKGGNTLVLRNKPVNSIGSLTCGSQSFTSGTFPYTGGSPVYFIRANGVISISGSRFECGQNNIQIVYNAGYNPVSITDEPATIPATPGPYSLFPFNANWRSSVGVKFFTGGTPLTQVFSAPTATGQFYVAPLGSPYSGQYQFASADQGKQILISYTYAGIPADIVEAVSEGVAMRYLKKNNLIIRSVIAGQISTTYITSRWTDNIRETVRIYRRGLYA